MIRVIICGECRERVHQAECREVAGPFGTRELICQDCVRESKEPTLPNADYVLQNLQEGRP